MQAVLIRGFTQFGHTHTLSHKRIERTCYPCLPVRFIGVSLTACIPPLKRVGCMPPFL
jgi:hypothetical protein